MAELPNCETLLLNLEGGVLHVTLNRPDSRNAMSLAMVGELRAVLDSVRANAEVRAIVLRGAGGHFCAGGDIKDMAGARAKGGDAYRELNRAFGAMLEEFQQAPQVVIALLTSLLPQLDAKAHGIGALLTVLYDESLRHAVPVLDQRLRDWLGGFTGSSAAAKTAKALLK